MRLITTIAAGVTGALALAGGSPAMAAAPPVAVVSCDYTSIPRDGSMLIPETAPAQYSALHITFVNNAPVTATDVVFAVRYGDHTQAVEEKGTFSSGISIAKDFPTSAYLPYNGPAACSVQSVTFSDGSAWQPA